MIVVTINLPIAYISALDEINKDNRSELVRQILWEHIEEEFQLRTKLLNPDYDTKIIAVNLSDTLVEILDNLVGRHSRSELIRTTIRDYLKKTFLNSSKGSDFEQKDVIFKEQDLVDLDEVNSTDPSNKTECISARVTETSKKALEEKAKQNNQKFSEFVRQTLEEKIQLNSSRGKQ